MALELGAVRLVHRHNGVCDPSCRASDETEEPVGNVGPRPVAEPHRKHVRREIVNVEDHACTAQAGRQRRADQEVGRSMDVDDIVPTAACQLPRSQAGEADVLTQGNSEAGTAPVVDRQAPDKHAVITPRSFRTPATTTTQKPI